MTSFRAFVNARLQPSQVLDETAVQLPLVSPSSWPFESFDPTLSPNDLMTSICSIPVVFLELCPLPQLSFFPLHWCNRSFVVMHPPLPSNTGNYPDP